MGCVILGRPFNFSVLLFPHLEMGVIVSTYCRLGRPAPWIGIAAPCHRSSGSGATDCRTPRPTVFLE